MPKNTVTVTVTGDVPESFLGIVTSRIVAKAFKDVDFSVSYGPTGLLVSFDDDEISFIEQFGEEARREEVAREHR